MYADASDRHHNAWTGLQSVARLIRKEHGSLGDHELFKVDWMKVWLVEATSANTELIKGCAVSLHPFTTVQQAFGWVAFRIARDCVLLSDEFSTVRGLPRPTYL